MVASTVLGRPRWTLAFSLVALLLYVAVSLTDVETAVLYRRRLAVLGVMHRCPSCGDLGAQSADAGE